MALKDWEKSRYGLYWRNVEKNQSVSVNFAVFNNRPNAWVMSVGTLGKFPSIHNRIFKTKAEAIAYAKKYMRRN